MTLVVPINRVLSQLTPDQLIFEYFADQLISDYLISSQNKLNLRNSKF